GRHQDWVTLDAESADTPTVPRGLSTRSLNQWKLCANPKIQPETKQRNNPDIGIDLKSRVSGLPRAVLLPLCPCNT
ncbi:mCG145829, partial [Mus musculus]